MSSVQELLTRMRANPKHVRFSDAKRVCDHYFGEPRIHGRIMCIARLGQETRGSTSKTAAAWSPHIKYVR